MGVNADGVHAFGVLHGRDERTGEPLLTPVEASGYAIAPALDGSGDILTLSDVNGVVVETFPPGTWSAVVNEIPGLDVPVTEDDR